MGVSEPVVSDHPERLDALNLLCGELIGRGISRHVFECRIRPDLVVKVEQGNRDRFQNILEWHAWSRVFGTPWEKWFAPVVEISHEGRLLLMKRTEPLRKKDLPAAMPAFFTDFKIQNYGMLDGRLVCHDYGTTLLMENGMSNRTRKVDHWRTDS